MCREESLHHPRFCPGCRSGGEGDAPTIAMNAQPVGPQPFHHQSQALRLSSARRNSPQLEPLTLTSSSDPSEEHVSPIWAPRWPENRPPARVERDISLGPRHANKLPRLTADSRGYDLQCAGSGRHLRPDEGQTLAIGRNTELRYGGGRLDPMDLILPAGFEVSHHDASRCVLGKRGEDCFAVGAPNWPLDTALAFHQDFSFPAVDIYLNDAAPTRTEKSLTVGGPLRLKGVAPESPHVEHMAKLFTGLERADPEDEGVRVAPQSRGVCEVASVRRELGRGLVADVVDLAPLSRTLS